MTALGEHLDDDWLKLPKPMLADFGPASQTFAAIVRLSGKERREVFARRELISELACRPLRSLDRDLATLCDAGLIENLGRRPFSSRSAKPRRSNTFVLTKDGEKFTRRHYLQLPRWACRILTRWADRVTLAAVVSRHLLIERMELEAHSREFYSLTQLAADTGLALRSVQSAKKSLAELGLIVIGERCRPRRGADGRLQSYADDIYLNLNFQIAIANRPANVSTAPSKSGHPPPANPARGHGKSGKRSEETQRTNSTKSTFSDLAGAPAKAVGTGGDAIQRRLDTSQLDGVLPERLAAFEAALAPFATGTNGHEVRG